MEYISSSINKIKRKFNESYIVRNYKYILAVIASSLFPVFATLSPAYALAGSTNVWWPVNEARVSGVQPFKAVVSGLSVNQYEMYWQVDGGGLNWMENNYTDYEHKEASVDLTNWNWRGAGPYKITFVAKQNGTIISEQTQTIYLNNVETKAIIKPEAKIVTPLFTEKAFTTITTSSVLNEQPRNTIPLYVNPESFAAKEVARIGVNNTVESMAVKLLSEQPTATWFGNWNSDIQNDAANLMKKANGKTPVIVAYNIPNRDCGSYSAGGSNNANSYISWVNSLAKGIGSNSVVVILEPDALSQITCLSDADQNTRLQILGEAVRVLKNNPNAKVYIDAGHSNWIDPKTMGSLLSRANVKDADGFSLNVSNFMSTSDEIAYGTSISKEIGGKHFVIDTSRNGNGTDGNWCNPNGRAIGAKPTMQTGQALVDGYLWVKVPGESDGNCNGGPGAGQWWLTYAVNLVQNAR